MEDRSSLATTQGMSASNWFMIVCLREYLWLRYSGEKEKRKKRKEDCRGNP